MNCHESYLHSVTTGDVEDEGHKLEGTYKMDQPGLPYPLLLNWKHATTPKEVHLLSLVRGVVQITPQRQAAVAPVGKMFHLPGPQSFVVGCQSFRADFLYASLTPSGVSMLVSKDFDKNLGHPASPDAEVAREVDEFNDFWVPFE